MTELAPLTLGKLELNPDTRVISGPRGQVQLADRYFRVAERLMRRPGVVVSTPDLISVVYPEVDGEPDNSNVIVRQLVSRMRVLIEHLGGSSVQITSDASVGYRLYLRGGTLMAPQHRLYSEEPHP